jgi:hypothetical protein
MQLVAAVVCRQRQIFADRILYSTDYAELAVLYGVQTKWL